MNKLTKPTEDEITETLYKCFDQDSLGGSKWPGMTYEQGVIAALRWIRGEDSNPMEDEE